MSAPLLLAFILFAIILQLGAGIGVTSWLRRKAALASAQNAVGLSATPAPRGAWEGLRSFRVVDRTFEDPARSQCSFRLQPIDGVALTRFEPGQYLTFALKLVQPAAAGASALRTLLRCYSISTAPDPASFRITVKRVGRPAGNPDAPPGLASAELLDRVELGDTLEAKAPAGLFALDPDPVPANVFVAGGIGIAPILSMLETALPDNPSRSFHLYYGVASGADHAFKGTLGDLLAAHANFHQTVAYAAPRAEDRAGIDFNHAGFIDVALLRKTLPAGRHRFYVCGPPGMMVSLVPALRDWGVGDDDIRTESFGPSSRGTVARKPTAAAGSTSPLADHALSHFDVQFRKTGRTIVWDGRDANLLDFAERHGVPVESGCRTGSCGACETKLAVGRVGYALKPGFTAAPGNCLPCVAVPLSDLRLEG
jgi:ferredoxin-NADP reductase